MCELAPAARCGLNAGSRNHFLRSFVIIYRYLRYLIEYDNPVSQIAGLNLLLSMLSLGHSEKILPAAVVDDSYRMLLNIAYPNKNNR